MGINKIAGAFSLKVDGALQNAYGEFTYRPSVPKRTAVKDSIGTVGFSEEVQEPYIEGEILDRGDLDLEKAVTIEDATITLELINGKTFTLEHAWYAGDATVKTSKANIHVRYEGRRGEEI
jgi:hypothetical protein